MMSKDDGYCLQPFVNSWEAASDSNKQQILM